MENEDLYKAMAAFLMCFGEGLPIDLKTRIRDTAHDLAERIERGGEPNVARLTKGLADALLAHLPMH